MQIIIKKVSELKLYDKNHRIHPKKQIDLLVKSIEKFGFTTPVLIDEDNEVIAGHGRLLALKQLQREDVSCVLIGGLSKEEIKALRLADNQVALLGETDFGLAIEELKGLSDEMFDLTGFDRDLLVEGNEKDDEVSDNAPPIAKLGDVWALGRHRVMCGDSTKKEDVERLMEGKKADMVFTDPPYGMNLDTDWSSAKSSLSFAKEKSALGGKKYDKVIGDNVDYDPEHIFRDLGYCKEIFLWGADYYAERLQNKNEGSWIVWDKRLEESADKMYGSCFELCWSKNKHKREIARVKWAGIFGTEKEPEHKRFHPTQKPVLLSEWFIKNFSGEEHLIADLFLGSGSTLIACEKTNRICYGMEIDEKYVDVIIKRFIDFTGKNAVRLNDDKKWSKISIQKS